MNGLKKVYFVLNKISDVICLLFEILAVLLVVVNAADVFLQVFNRYVLVKISNILNLLDISMRVTAAGVNLSSHHS